MQACPRPGMAKGSKVEEGQEVVRGGKRQLRAKVSPLE